MVAAAESLTHAQTAGEILTGLDGHPTLDMTLVEETDRHGVLELLEESLAHEKHALGERWHLCHYRACLLRISTFPLFVSLSVSLSVCRLLSGIRG